jgi:hypothetical protein
MGMKPRQKLPNVSTYPIQNSQYRVLQVSGEARNGAKQKKQKNIMGMKPRQKCSNVRALVHMPYTSHYLEYAVHYMEYLSELVPRGRVMLKELVRFSAVVGFPYKKNKNNRGAG